jgi:hypothetical protein
VDGDANPELIHQSRARPDLVADADAMPQRLVVGVNNPHGCRNARMGRIYTFHF